jgi:hypothetical protein
VLIEYNPPVAILLLDLPLKLSDGMLDGTEVVDDNDISNGSEKIKVEVETNRIFLYTHAALLEIDEVL